MRASHSLDRLDAAFDDEHLVADGGLLLPATLAHHLGLKDLVEAHLDLGRAHVGDKLLTLVLSAGRAFCAKLRERRCDKLSEWHDHGVTFGTRRLNFKRIRVEHKPWRPAQPAYAALCRRSSTATSSPSGVPAMVSETSSPMQPPHI